MDGFDLIFFPFWIRKLGFFLNYAMGKQIFLKRMEMNFFKNFYDKHFKKVFTMTVRDYRFIR